MREHHRVSIHQSCKAVGIPRSTYSYKRKPKNDQPVIEALLGLTEKHPAIGLEAVLPPPAGDGPPLEPQAACRASTALRLNIRRRAKKRLPARAKQQLFQPEGPNQVWSLHFTRDSLWDGRSFRMLNVIDDYNRQVLPVETDTSLPALRVIRGGENLKDSRGLPQMIRVDNGPEFISRKLDNWCKDNNVTLAFIQLGKPTQNAYVERLNGSIRTELLNAYIFKTLGEVREKVAHWKYDYNHNRPHKSLGYQTPMELLT